MGKLAKLSLGSPQNQVSNHHGHSVQLFGQDWSGAWLLVDHRLGAGQPLAEAAAFGRQFGARQVGRMETVGCKDTGVWWIDKSYFISPVIFLIPLQKLGTVFSF